MQSASMTVHMANVPCSRGRTRADCKGKGDLGLRHHPPIQPHSTSSLMFRVIDNRTNRLVPSSCERFGQMSRLTLDDCSRARQISRLTLGEFTRAGLISQLALGEFPRIEQIFQFPLVSIGRPDPRKQVQLVSNRVFLPKIGLRLALTKPRPSCEVTSVAFPLAAVPCEVTSVAFPLVVVPCEVTSVAFP